MTRPRKGGARKPRTFKSRLARRRHFAKQVRTVIDGWGHPSIPRILTDLAERIFAPEVLPPRRGGK